MLLIACKECASEISSEAVTCPKCGVRVKPKSKVWIWVLGVPIGLFAVFAIIGSNNPTIQAMQRDRAPYEACIAQLNDPLTDPSAKVAIVRPVCERLRNEFINKYKTEP